MKLSASPARRSPPDEMNNATNPCVSVRRSERMNRATLRAPRGRGITAPSFVARFRLSARTGWPEAVCPSSRLGDNPCQATQSRVTNSQNARPAWSPYRANRRRIWASLTVFFPITRGVLRPGPRVEDRTGVPADRHHDVRGCVRPHARERQQALLELRVGELVGGGGRQRLEVELAVGDRSTASERRYAPRYPARATSR